MGVGCEEVRAALSALMDGEDPGIDPTSALTHVEACAGCRAYRAAAADLHRRVRVRSAPELPDLAQRVLDRVADDAAARTTGRRRVLAGRIVLACIALVQLAVAAPVLLLGQDQQAPLHVAHELGSFSVAISVGLLLSAYRPRLSAGMLPIVGVIAILLLFTAGGDVASGRTQVADEAPHLLEFSAFLVLWWLSKASAPAGGRRGPLPSAAGLRPVGSH
jgi:predicted anti-sigma-YlaC factor YlaD